MAERFITTPTNNEIVEKINEIISTSANPDLDGVLSTGNTAQDKSLVLNKAENDTNTTLDWNSIVVTNHDIPNQTTEAQISNDNITVKLDGSTTGSFANYKSDQLHMQASSGAVVENFTMAITPNGNTVDAEVEMSNKVKSAWKTTLEITDLEDKVEEHAESITTLQEDVAALQGAVIYIGTIDLSTADVTPELLTARAAQLGYPTLKTGYTLIDNDGAEWRYDEELGTWVNTGSGPVVSQATNDTLGIVKGSTAAMKVSVDTVGEMTLNGLSDKFDEIETKFNSVDEMLEDLASRVDGPLSNYYTYVNAYSTTGIEDGTMENPYLTVQSAINAKISMDAEIFIIYIIATLNLGEDINFYNENISISGNSEIYIIGDTTLAYHYDEINPFQNAIGINSISVTLGTPSITLANIYVGSKDNVSEKVENKISTGNFVAYKTDFYNDFTITTSGVVGFSNSRLHEIDATDTNISFYECSAIQDGTFMRFNTGGEYIFNKCHDFIGTMTHNNGILTFANCYDMPINIVSSASDASDKLNIINCNFLRSSILGAIPGGNLTKTGTCEYSLTNSAINIIQLSGTRNPSTTMPYLTSNQIVDKKARNGYNTDGYFLDQHLDAISDKLDTIEVGGDFIALQIPNMVSIDKDEQPDWTGITWTSSLIEQLYEAIQRNASVILYYTDETNGQHEVRMRSKESITGTYTEDTTTWRFIELYYDHINDVDIAQSIAKNIRIDFTNTQVRREYRGTATDINEVLQYNNNIDNEINFPTYSSGNTIAHTNIADKDGFAVKMTTTSSGAGTRNYTATLRKNVENNEAIGLLVEAINPTNTDVVDRFHIKMADSGVADSNLVEVDMTPAVKEAFRDALDVSSSGVGESTKGIDFVKNGETYTGQEGAERFNSYHTALFAENIAVGTFSHAEGVGTFALGSYSHAEGWNTSALQTGAHAEGYGTVAGLQYAHAEGQDTIASGLASHAEGRDTNASGAQSHAEGGDTQATGATSHAEGFATVAAGTASHAANYGTIANSYQSAVGRFNLSLEGPTSNSDMTGSLFIVGNGTNADRSNAFVVNTSGTVTVGANPVNAMDVATKEYVDNSASTSIKKTNMLIGLMQMIKVSSSFLSDVYGNLNLVAVDFSPTKFIKNTNQNEFSFTCIPTNLDGWNPDMKRWTISVQTEIVLVPDDDTKIADMNIMLSDGQTRPMTKDEMDDIFEGISKLRGTAKCVIIDAETSELQYETLVPINMTFTLDDEFDVYIFDLEVMLGDIGLRDASKEYMLHFSIQNLDYISLSI